MKPIFAGWHRTIEALACGARSAMVRAIQELSTVTRIPARFFSRVATFGVLALALGLTGCGRKGPLDLPSSAAVAEPAQAAPQKPGPMGASPFSGPPKRDEPEAFGPTGAPVAPKGQKKALFLDWLID
jgi:predicted small lipoprotein YifL